MAAGVAQAIASVDDLLAAAAAMEAAAVRRYHWLAAWWEAEGERDLAGLFARLAEMEAAHLAALGEPDAPPPATPEPSPDADAVAWRSALLTPYRALSLAVRAEEEAFAFYAEVAAHAAAPGLRAQAEDLARAELGHAALLRTARRAAFRAERRPRPPPVMDVVALERQSAEWEAEEEAASTRPGRLRAASRNVERYLEVAERTGNETVLTAAQGLAAAALRRLTALRAGSDRS